MPELSQARTPALRVHYLACCGGGRELILLWGGRPRPPHPARKASRPHFAKRLLPPSCPDSRAEKKYPEGLCLKGKSCSARPLLLYFATGAWEGLSQARTPALQQLILCLPALREGKIRRGAPEPHHITTRGAGVLARHSCPPHLFPKRHRATFCHEDLRPPSLPSSATGTWKELSQAGTPALQHLNLYCLRHAEGKMTETPALRHLRLMPAGATISQQRAGKFIDCCGAGVPARHNFSQRHPGHIVP